MHQHTEAAIRGAITITTRLFQIFSRKMNSIQNQESCAAVRVDYPTRIAHIRRRAGILKMFTIKNNNVH